MCTPHQEAVLFIVPALWFAGAVASTGIPAATGVVEHSFTTTVAPGVAPVLTLWAPKADVAYVVECSAGDERLAWETASVPADEKRAFVLHFEDESLRGASCAFAARMANGLSQRQPLPVAWEVKKPDAADQREADESQPDSKVPPAESVVTVPPNDAKGEQKDDGTD